MREWNQIWLFLVMILLLLLNSIIIVVLLLRFDDDNVSYSPVEVLLGEGLFSKYNISLSEQIRQTIQPSHKNQTLLQQVLPLTPAVSIASFVENDDKYNQHHQQQQSHYNNEHLFVVSSRRLKKIQKTTSSSTTTSNNNNKDIMIQSNNNNHFIEQNRNMVTTTTSIESNNIMKHDIRTTRIDNNNNMYGWYRITYIESFQERNPEEERVPGNMNTYEASSIMTNEEESSSIMAIPIFVNGTEVNDMYQMIDLSNEFIQYHMDLIVLGQLYVVITPSPSILLNDERSYNQIVIQSNSTITVVDNITKQKQSENDKTPILLPIKTPVNAVRSIGNKTIIIIRITTLDSEPIYNMNELYNGMFNNSGINIKTQYEKCSFGQLTWNLASTNGMIEIYLNQSISNFVSGGELVRYALNQLISIGPSDNTKKDDNNNKPIRNIQSLADKVLIVVPSGTGGWVANSGINYWRAQFNDKWSLSLSALMHELGHSIGLSHSNENNIIYDDQTSYMSAAYSSHIYPQKCFNGIQNYQLKWYRSRTRTLSIEQLLYKSFLLHLATFVDYDITGNQNNEIVILNIMDLLFLQYNVAKKFNVDTEEMKNQTTITSQEKQGSSLLKGLSVGDSFFIYIDIDESYFTESETTTSTRTASFNERTTTSSIALLNRTDSTTIDNIPKRDNEMKDPIKKMFGIQTLPPLPSDPNSVKKKTRTVILSIYACELTTGELGADIMVLSISLKNESICFQTEQPTYQPSSPPTEQPSSTPSISPTISSKPTSRPTVLPSSIPTSSPSFRPTYKPSHTPTISPKPTRRPTKRPTTQPTRSPSIRPTHNPSNVISTTPSVVFSTQPTKTISASPSISNQPTKMISITPSAVTSTHPSSEPTITISNRPSLSNIPTNIPSIYPSNTPSKHPSSIPSNQPSYHPSNSNIPTISPSVLHSSLPSKVLSTTPSKFPSLTPSNISSKTPTILDSAEPSMKPTISIPPSNVPSHEPSEVPSNLPSYIPSDIPSDIPTIGRFLINDSTNVDVAPTSSPIREKFELTDNELELVFNRTKNNNNNQRGQSFDISLLKDLFKKVDDNDNNNNNSQDDTTPSKRVKIEKLKNLYLPTTNDESEAINMEEQKNGFVLKSLFTNNNNNENISEENELSKETLNNTTNKYEE